MFIFAEEFVDFFNNQEIHWGMTGNSEDNGPTPIPVPTELQGFGNSKVWTRDMRQSHTSHVVLLPLNKA